MAKPERIRDVLPEALERLNVAPVETIYDGIRFRSRLETSLWSERIITAYHLARFERFIR